MRSALLIEILVLSAFAARIDARPPPLGDPVTLNIGINCQWQQQCIKQQGKAMKRSLKYVRKSQPPVWRVQMCNRNAGRQRVRVDWVGFDNCIRNTVLRPIPVRVLVKAPMRATKASVRNQRPARRIVSRRPPRLTESAPPALPAGPGERG